FHPKAQMVFGPALGLGVASLGELVDVRLGDELAGDALCARLQAASPNGLDFLAARRLAASEPGLAKRVTEAEYAAVLPDRSGGELAELLAVMLARAEIPVHRASQQKTFDLRRYLKAIALGPPGPLSEALEWPSGPVVRFRLS